MLANEEQHLRPSPSLRRLMLDAIRSPRRAGVTVSQTANGTATEIRLSFDDGTVRCWTVRVAPQQISDRDIRPIKNYLERPRRLFNWLMAVPQLLGWSVGLTGLFAASTICPCCGQVGCAVGVGTLGIMGGLTASIVSLLRRRRHRNEESQPC